MDQTSLFTERIYFKGIPIEHPDVVFVKTKRCRQSDVLEGLDHYEFRYKSKPLFIYHIGETGDKERPINFRGESMEFNGPWSFSGWSDMEAETEGLNRLINRFVQEEEE